VKHLKVVLTNEQAEALESALDLQGSNLANVVEWHATNLWDGKRKALNGLQLDTLIRALYVGYEVEPSRDEKLRALYMEHKVPNGPGYHLGVLCGIQEVLNIYGIKVRGVNC
jgi:hypothetical protein